jgi:hypothetical protein
MVLHNTVDCSKEMQDGATQHPTFLIDAGATTMIAKAPKHQ